jgi:hypothetical protein
MDIDFEIGCAALDAALKPLFVQASALIPRINEATADRKDTKQADRADCCEK